MNTLYKTTLAAAFCAVAGISTQAFAGDFSETKVSANRVAKEVAVDYTDLDLNTPQGQEKLYYRISRAAKQICGPTQSRMAGGLSQAAENRACYKESLSRALSEIPNTAVATTN